jgi:DNA-binding MarR family transcriptional regulator
VLGFWLKRAQHAYRTRLDADLRPLGLTAPQYAVLATIATEPGASNAGLARAAFVTAQTMQGILSTLERSGLLRRTPHPQHGRVLETTLTEQGAILLAQARDRVERIEQLLVTATKGESDQFVRLLSQIVDHLSG